MNEPSRLVGRSTVSYGETFRAAPKGATVLVHSLPMRTP